MATGTGEPGDPGQRPGGRPKRPPPTIDLQATEVSASAASSSDRGVEIEDAASTVPPETAAPAETAEPHSSHVPPEETKRDKQERASGSPAGAPRAWPGPSALAWPVAGGAVVGAAVSFLVLGGLWLTGALQSRTGDTAPLANRLAAVETQLRELAQRPAAAPAALPPDIRPRLEAAEQGARGAAALETRLARVEQMLAQAETSSGAPPPADVRLAERVDAAETSARAAEVAARSIAERLADVTRRLNDAEALAREARTRVEQTASSARETQKIAESLSAEASSDLTAVTARLAALEERTNELQRVAANAARSSPDPAARFALAAAMLRSAVESGEPFAAQLDAVRLLMSDQNTLASLAPYAAKGVPSLNVLQQSFRDVAVRLAEAGPRSAPREGGLVDRLQSSAERLVRIRPLGEPVAAEDSGIVNRSQSLVARGDLAAALAELAKLPPALKAPAEPWMKEAQARLEALASARKLSADAVADLGHRP